MSPHTLSVLNKPKQVLSQCCVGIELPLRVYPIGSHIGFSESDGIEDAVVFESASVLTMGGRECLCLGDLSASLWG